MQPKNHGQKSPIVFIMVWVLLVIFQNFSLATDLQPKPRESRPSRILLDPKYYAIADPVIAAAKMREDSREYGIDENVNATTNTEYKFFSKNSGKVRIALPADAFVFDINDQANKLSFESSELEKTVIFVADRYLSINEVASMMESGIRIFKRLYAYSPRMAFLVKVSAESYAELEKQPFFLFATEYGYQFKCRSDCPEGERVQYHIDCLGEYNKSRFSEDLEKLGFELGSFSEKGNSISAFGRCDQFQAAASLWWVEDVYWDPIVRSDDEVFEESYLFNRKACDDSLRLSWASRNLIAGKWGWDGVGVNVGILEGGLVFEDGPLDGVLLDGSDKVTLNPDLTSNHPSGMSYLIAGRRDMQNDCTDDVLQGMATRSMILFQSFSSSELIDDYFHDFDDAGIQLSSHSYGFVVEPGQYTERVQSFDEHAGTGSIMFASVGSISPDDEVIHSPAMGKNVIAIGGVIPFPVSGYKVGQIYPNGVVGPSEYGMLKPELVAPAGNGTSSFGIPQYRPVSDDSQKYCSLEYYRKKSGTSTATALATGAIATALPGIRADAELDEGDNIRSDLVKALVINSAIPLKGNDPDGAKGHANCTFGYGLINPFSCVYKEGDEFVDPYLRREVIYGNVEPRRLSENPKIFTII